MTISWAISTGDEYRTPDIYNTWNDARLKVEQLFLSFISRGTREGAQTAFDIETIDNVRAFIDYAEKHFPTPDEIIHGYWPTVCLRWSKAAPYPVAIEIFDDRFEFYRTIPLKVDVIYFEHSARTPFPVELAAILSTELR